MAQQTVTVSKAEIIEILRNISNPTFVSMVTDTEVKMNKFQDYYKIAADGTKTKNPDAIPNPYVNGVRVLATKYKIITGFDYEKSVVNRLAKEGKEASEYQKGESWHVQVSPALAKHKDKDSYYFRYQYLPESTTSKEYRHGADIVNEADIKPFMQPHSDYKNQGLDNTLNFQVVAIENIRKITMNHTEYIIN